MLQLNNRTLAVGGPAREIGPRRKNHGRIKGDMRHVRTAARRSFLDARRERNAIEHVLRLPEVGESIHLVLSGAYEPGHLIPAFRAMSHPETIEELDVVTLSFNPDNLSMLCRGLEQKKIAKVRLIVSNFFEKAERALFAMAKEELEKRGSSIHSARIHAKIFLLSMSNGIGYAIEGSGNLRSNRSYEAFVLTNDVELVAFHRGWLDSVIEESKK